MEPPNIGHEAIAIGTTSTPRDKALDDTQGNPTGERNDSQPGLPPSDTGAPSMSVPQTSSPLDKINASRRQGLQQSTLTSRMPPDIQARLKAFHLGRQGTPTNVSSRSVQGQVPSENPSPSSTTSPRLGPGGVPSTFRIPPTMSRPAMATYNSAPTTAKANPPLVRPSLAHERGIVPSSGPTVGQAGTPPRNAKKKPGLTLSQMKAGPGQDGKLNDHRPTGTVSLLDKYSDFIDTATGSLRFKGKATLTNHGVEFEGGKSFTISLDEVDTLDELGKGNYGTVYKVRHSRPRMRRPGLGLAGNKASPAHYSQAGLTQANRQHTEDAEVVNTGSTSGLSGIIMALKEIRLELEDAKFAAIIMELDILHRCMSPYIVDFYGAFFQEGAVYICMEFMDGGSIDKLYTDGMPENVLRKVALATVLGLKTLKDEHNIIHRDVKPTNILVNTKGQIKICDFGVSGNLVASIAKTNIGCQSYMAPERISSGGVAQAGANPGGGTYSVQSDIWSLGLTIIECALGQYPYPPETYDNIFSQLSAIVDGDPPDLPTENFSEAAHNFVSGCLMKIPKLRPTYAMLLQHAWLAPLIKPPTIVEEDEDDATKELGLGEEATDERTSSTSIGLQVADQEVANWVLKAIERRRNNIAGKKATPALHAAPLDAVPKPDGDLRRI